MTRTLKSLRQQIVIALLQLSSALSLCSNSVYRWDNAPRIRLCCPLWENITTIVQVKNYTMCMCEQFAFDSHNTTTHCFLLQVRRRKPMYLLLLFFVSKFVIFTALGPSLLSFDQPIIYFDGTGAREKCPKVTEVRENWISNYCPYHTRPVSTF